MSHTLSRSVRPAVLLVPAFFLLFFGAPALALPEPSPTSPGALPEPYSPWGTVTVDGASAGDGLSVTASVTGVGVCASTTTTNGYYALNVPGDDPDTMEKEGGQPGDTVVFAVDGCGASPTGSWSSGTSERLDISVTFPTWYQDGDDDGYGNPSVSTEACPQPDGYVADNTDCDDTDPAIHPGATEIIDDGTDQDCNGGELCYLDGDDDGYRPDATSTTPSADLDCHDAGEAAQSDPTGDCNDGDAGINPGAAEIPNDAIDQDCNGTDATLCIVDGDRDGYGTSLGTTVLAPDGTCDTAQGESTSADDCDDADAAIHPGAAEVSGDGIDQDCNGADAVDCYVDGDTDGYGTALGTSVQALDGICHTAQGESTSADDCDDADPAIHPGATEIIGDGIDQDCNGGEICYVDSDDDSYRPDATSTTVSADLDCNDAGEAASSDPTGDCHDGDAAIHPGATEVWYDGVDQDCDGGSDYDQDGDGSDSSSYGGTDCDDTDDSIYPTATEVCDGTDNDCDDQIDEGFPDTDGDSDADCVDGDDDDDGTSDADDCAPLDDTRWQLLPSFIDGDEDAFGTGASQDVCAGSAVPDGYADNGDDCDDTDAAVNPDASEACDGFDNDCDGQIDEDFPDTDSDGHADCVDDDDDDDGTSDADDCAPLDEARWQLIPAFADGDGDGFGSGASRDLCSGTALPDGYADTGGDCDDTHPAVNPGANEVCNGIDDDCDTRVDDGDPDCTGQPTWYADGDEDGYGDPTVSVRACSQPGGYVADNTDCDDTDSAIHPAADEVCNGIDDDCDSRVDDEDPGCTGQPTWYADADEDGYGDPAVSVQACSQPTDYVADNTDCDDTDSAVHPAADEICDGIDDDCDGDIDADDADCAAPTAHAGGPYTGTRAHTIMLDGTGSTDSDGTIATYEWVVDDAWIHPGSAPTCTLDLSGYSLGDHAVALRVRDDDQCTDVASTTLTMLNAPPVGSDDTATVAEDSAHNAINVLDNDSDPDPGETLSVTAVGDPDHGSVSNNTTDVSYTPDRDFCGTDTFTYTLSDGSGGFDTAAVGVGVTCVNDPPVAKDDCATTEEGTSVVIDLVRNDTDIDGTIDPTTVSVVTSPSHGSLTIGTDGTVTYTPGADYVGDDSFTYTVDDVEGETSNEATVRVAVEAPAGHMIYLPLLVRAH